MQNNKIIFIIGPTGVGKSAVALALTAHYKSEIVSCDSMQVYRGMDIGTGKVAAGEQERIKHHMIDVAAPHDEYNVAQFRDAATMIIEELIAHGTMPIVVGGSPLYARALTDGLFEIDRADTSVKERLRTQLRDEGLSVLYERLQKIDPATARSLAPNDARRIIRALEVFKITGRAISRLKEETTGLSARYPVQFFALMMPRGLLYKRIEARIDSMIAEGFLDEVRTIHAAGGFGRTASLALGYKELLAHLAGAYTLDEAVRLIKRNTRRFAKRQLSWFRQDKRITWVDTHVFTSPEEIARHIIAMSDASATVSSEKKGFWRVKTD